VESPFEEIHSRLLCWPYDVLDLAPFFDGDLDRLTDDDETDSTAPVRSTCMTTRLGSVKEDDTEVLTAAEAKPLREPAPLTI